MAGEHKRIIIKSRGPIYPKSGMYGPMLTPFFQDVQTINALVVNGYHVEEVLDNGERVKLTLENVKKNHNEKINNAKQAEQEAATKAAREKAEAEAKAAKEAAAKEQQKQQQQNQKNKQHPSTNNKVEDATVAK